ncbi:site-specific integrase [Clostridia bacterium]|nr:site-specific integrase [Clostridia bacterium]
MSREKVERNIYYDTERELYYVNFDYGKDETGKRVKSAKTFKKKSEAKKALTIFEAGRISKTIVAPTFVKLSEWLEYWLNTIKAARCEETTLYGYRNIINKHLVPALGDMRLQAITPTVINKYMTAKQAEGLGANTIGKHYTVLKDALKHAVNEEKIPKNPCDRVNPLKVERKEINFYDTATLQKLFALVEGNRLEIVVKLAGALGMRREEISGLKWGNVDFSAKTLLIVEARTQVGGQYVEKKPKNTTSHRTLHIPDDISELLKNLKAQQEREKALLCAQYIDGGYVMAWENGEPYRPNYISELFTKFIKDNGLPTITLHGLRHSFASIANELGINMFDISKALGHSAIATTSKIYTHMFDPTHTTAIDKVAAALGGK